MVGTSDMKTRRREFATLKEENKGVFKNQCYIILYNDE